MPTSRKRDLHERTRADLRVWRRLCRMAIRDELFSPGYTKGREICFNLGDVFRKVDKAAEVEAVFSALPKAWSLTARRIWHDWGDASTILWALLFSELPPPPREEDRLSPEDLALLGGTPVPDPGSGSGPSVSLAATWKAWEEEADRRRDRILRALHEAIGLQVFERFRRPWGEKPPRSPVTARRLARTLYPDNRADEELHRRLYAIAKRAGGPNMRKSADDVVMEITSRILMQGYTSLSVKLDKALLYKIARSVGVDAKRRADSRPMSDID